MLRDLEYSDDQLLRRIIAGEEDSFVCFYRRWQARIFRFALHMSGSASVAEDVAQETFMSVIRDASRFDPALGTASAYLFGIARNQVLRRLEKDRMLVPFPEPDEAPLESRAKSNGNGHHATSVQPVDLARKQTIEHVREAVLSLPGHYREVVVLCDLQEMSYDEAAAAGLIEGLNMKSADFSEIVSDLARNEGLDEAVRQSAFLHADACPRCDEELVMARSLSAALHGLAASSTAASAPVRVENFLRGEMRQRRAAVAPTRMARAPHAQRWALGGIAGLAAAALISVVLLKPEILRLRGANAPAGSTQTTGATVQGSEATAQVAPASGNSGTVSAPDENSQQTGNSSPANSNGAGTAAQDTEAEYATTYVDLPSAEGANFSEDQTVVRVSMPRSALASFGLPVRSDVSDANVLADFVLGEDGMPRAVRLVQ